MRSYFRRCEPESQPLLPQAATAISSARVRAKDVAAQVHLTTPGPLLAPHRGVDAMVGKLQARWHNRLETSLENNSKTDRPKVFLQRYVPQMCALTVAAGLDHKLVALRDAALERPARGGINWAGSALGKGVAYTVAVPAQWAGSSRGAAWAVRSGTAVGSAVAWPLHGGVEAVSLLWTSGGLCVATAGLAVGFVGGYGLTYVLLAFTPQVACSAWLRLRGLQATGARYAEETRGWLLHFGGGASATPSSDGKLLSFGGDPSQSPSEQLEALASGYKNAINQAVANTDVAHREPNAQIDHACRQLGAAAAEMPWALRRMLAADKAASVASPLHRQHREVCALLEQARDAPRFRAAAAQAQAQTQVARPGGRRSRHEKPASVATARPNGQG